MKINSFRAGNVHGYLNFDITFFPDLTFLIGINGSGKTSALKLILGLTSPSFYYLNQLQYDFCEVVCSAYNDESEITIRSEKVDTNSFIISLTYQSEIVVSSPIARIVKDDDSPYDSEELYIAEQRKREQFESFDVVKKIRELETPKFLGLDRRIYEGRLIDSRFKNRRFGHLPKFGRRGSELLPCNPPLVRTGVL